MSRVLPLPVAALVVGALLASAQARVWTDRSGKHTTNAELLRVENDTVVLKRADGAVISVPISKLSDADRQFVQPAATAPSQPGVFDAAQRQAEARLEETVKQLTAIDRDGNKQQISALYQSNQCLTTDTLLACTGDTAACVEDLPPGGDPGQASNCQLMTRYLLAAETKLHLGQVEDGKKLIRAALDIAPHIHSPQGYLSMGDYGVAADILARLGAMKEVDELIAAAPRGSGRPGENAALLRLLVCRSLLAADKPALVEKMTGPIPAARNGGLSASLGKYYLRHGDRKRAVDDFVAAITASVPESADALRLLDILAELDAWDRIEEVLARSKKIGNRLRAHAADRLIELGRLDEAVKMTEAMQPERPRGREADSRVLFWLKLSAAFAARGAAARQLDCLGHAKEIAIGLAKTGEELHWTEITGGYDASIIALIGIAGAQKQQGDAKGAAATLSEALRRARGGPPAPIGFQGGQGGNGDDMIRHRDEMLTALVRAFLQQGDRPTAEKTAAEIKQDWQRNQATELLKPPAGGPIRPAPDQESFVRQVNADTAIHNYARTGEAEAAFKLMAQFPDSPMRISWAITTGEGAANADDTAAVLKAVSLVPRIDRDSVAFLGVLCTAHREMETAKKLLELTKQADEPKHGFGRELNYGDPQFHEVFLLLRARLGDSAVIAEIGRKIAALPKSEARPALDMARPYNEWAMIQALAGATAKDLEWTGSLPVRDRYRALNGAAQGYLERMSGIPAESRRFLYRQSGFL